MPEPCGKSAERDLGHPKTASCSREKVRNVIEVKWYGR